MSGLSFDPNAHAIAGCQPIPQVSPLRVSGSGGGGLVCAPVYVPPRLFPQELMSVGRIEKLFMSQRRWEGGDVGLHCLDVGDRRTIFEKQQFVLQFYLGFLKINPASRERRFTHAVL